jgi:hypothetical protein
MYSKSNLIKNNGYILMSIPTGLGMMGHVIKAINRKELEIQIFLQWKMM